MGVGVGVACSSLSFSGVACVGMAWAGVACEGVACAVSRGGRGRGLRERGLPFLVLRGGGLIKVGSQIYINQNKSIVHTNKLGS